MADDAGDIHVVIVLWHADAGKMMWKNSASEYRLMRTRTGFDFSGGASSLRGNALVLKWLNCHLRPRTGKRK